MMRATILLVAGMHRSGTSAFTGTLAILGATPPKELMPPSDNNPKGYWESPNIRDVHDEALASAGTSWDSPLPVDAAWFESDDANRIGEKLRQVVGQEFEDTELVVVKDPRVCLLLPLWRAVFPQADLRVVMPFRNPLEVAASLRERNSMGQGYVHLLWMRYVLAAEHGSRGLPRSFISYEGLLGDWVSAIEGLEEGLGLALPIAKGEAAVDVEGFLTPSYRHSHVGDEEVRALADPPKVSEIYQLLRACSSTGEPKNLSATLDEVRSSLDVACSWMGASLWQERELSGRAREQLQRRCRALEKEADARSRRLDSLHAARDELQAASSRATRELAELREELKRLRTSTVDRNEVVEARLAKQRVEEEMTPIKAERDALAESLKHRFVELRLLQEEISVRDAKLKKLRGDVAVLSSQVEEMRGAITYRLGHALAEPPRSWDEVKSLTTTLRKLAAEKARRTSKREARSASAAKGSKRGSGPRSKGRP